MSYKSLSGTHLREKIIEKSRFLTYTAHTAGEEDARAFLAICSDFPMTENRRGRRACLS